MPTGYTYKIQEGKTTSLKEFFTDISAAFFPECRDQKEIDKENKFCKDQIEHYKQCKKDEEKKLINFNNSSTDAIKQKYIDNYNDAIKKAIAGLERAVIVNNNYAEMIRKLTALECPDQLTQNIKKFGLEQLKESSKFDNMANYYAKQLEEATDKLSNIDTMVAVLREDELKGIQHSINYYDKKIKEYEQKLINDNTQRDQFFEFLKTIPD